MTDRASCERRVYRLATLLTGDPNAAVRVIEQVVGAQPDLRRLDAAHMDRLAVLRSREIPPVTLPVEAGGGGEGGRRVVRALAALNPQQRESWVFAHVYRMQPREIAKAMDCSVRAVQVHLTSADGVMNDQLKGGVSAAADALLRYSMALQVPGFYRAYAARRRMWRMARRWLPWVILLAVLAAAWFVVDRMGWLDPWIGAMESTGGSGGEVEAGGASDA